MLKALDLSWQADGECNRRRMDPDDFFFEGKYEKHSEEYRAAKAKVKAVCAVCPVQKPCLQYALDTDQREGIWGGTTAGDRRAVKWPRKRTASAS